MLWLRKHGNSIRIGKSLDDPLELPLEDTVLPKEIGEETRTYESRKSRKTPKLKSLQPSPKEGHHEGVENLLKWNETAAEQITFVSIAVPPDISQSIVQSPDALIRAMQFANSEQPLKVNPRSKANSRISILMRSLHLI